MTRGDPVGLPALAVVSAGLLAFFVAVLAARWRRGREARGGVRSTRSLAGIAIQALGLVVVMLGAPPVTLDPLGTPAIVDAAACAVLMASAVGLFVWASRTMGRNWSLMARTRLDHQLVTTGPFAWLRHPIYSAIALLLIGLAIGLGHLDRLWLALPLYAVGTWLRIAEEERLLQRQFGDAYRRYAASVHRFVPGLF